MRNDRHKMYSLFTYEDLHNLNMRMVQIRKECLFALVSSGSVVKGR